MFNPTLLFFLRPFREVCSANSCPSWRDSLSVFLQMCILFFSTIIVQGGELALFRLSAFICNPTMHAAASCFSSRLCSDFLQHTADFLPLGVEREREREGKLQLHQRTTCIHPRLISSSYPGCVGFISMSLSVVALIKITVALWTLPRTRSRKS